MVLRKMLDKFRSRSEPKKGSEEPEKSNSSKEQKQDRGHGGGDTRKKLKKVRSVRVADLDGIRKDPKKTGHLPLSKSPQQVTAEVPNYMKSTTSYEARKEKNKVTTDSSTPPTTTASKPLSSAARALVKNSSLKLLRSSMKKNKRKNLQTSMNTSRATCSSTIKDSKTPKSVDLNEHHDALALKVCPYTYCSLHGHKHGVVPSLKRFLSARRQSLKVQKSIKLRGYSSIKKKGDMEFELVEDVVNELFIEIHSKLQERGEESSGDKTELIDIINRMNEMKVEDPNDASQLQESCSVTSIEDCGDKTSELSMEDIQVINQFLEFIEKGCEEETKFETEKTEQGDGEVKLSSFLHSRYVNCNETAIHKVCSQSQNDGGRSQSTCFINGTEEEVSSSENEHLRASVVLPHSPQRSAEEDWATLEAGCGERQEDISKANFNNFPSENNVKDCSSLVSRSKGKYSKLRRRSMKFRESVKEFNPRPPRLLALKAEPEQEQVNLKHQTVDERKATEEWMVDYALRKALRRLASARKKKVPLLVAAFETVMPNTYML